MFTEHMLGTRHRARSQAGGDSDGTACALQEPPAQQDRHEQLPLTSRGSKLKSMPSAKSHHILLVIINMPCFSYQMHTSIWDLRPSYIHTGASLVAQMVKNPPTMQETWIQSLG